MIKLVRESFDEKIRYLLPPQAVAKYSAHSERVSFGKTSVCEATSSTLGLIYK
jgi:hypothetical protein